MKKILAIFIIILLISLQNSQAVLAKKNSQPSAISQSTGYVGNLPNLEERFHKSDFEEVKPTFEYKDGFNDPDAIKPVPRNNPAFINIIMKKDKTSQYINDLNDLITIIEKMQNIIESGQDVQKFNAEAFFLRENVEYFRDKYKNKPEESFISYKKVMQLNTQVQSIAMLRKEKEVYSPYVTAAGTGNMFTNSNIENQLNYLNDNIIKTLVVLKETR